MIIADSRVVYSVNTSEASNSFIGVRVVKKTQVDGEQLYDCLPLYSSPTEKATRKTKDGYYTFVKGAPHWLLRDADFTGVLYSAEDAEHSHGEPKQLRRESSEEKKKRKEKRKQSQERFEAFIKDLWGITKGNFSGKRIPVRKEYRFETIVSGKGICPNCHLKLWIDKTYMPCTDGLWIQVGGLYCQKCKTMYVINSEVLKQYIKRNKVRAVCTLNGEVINQPVQPATNKHEVINQPVQPAIKKHEVINQSVQTAIKKHNDPSSPTGSVLDREQALVPQISTDDTLYIYNEKLSCHQKNHSIIDCVASLPGIGDKEVKFYVEYCQECREYYMCYKDYEGYLANYHILPMRVQLNSAWMGDDYSRSSLRDESPLFQYGYTVNAETSYSSAERQQILSYIMDHRYMEKSKILDYLRFFIKQNENHRWRAVAIHKWKEDKEFVLNYCISEHRKVSIGKIEVKKR